MFPSPDEYRAAEPFAHAVVDGLFDDRLLACAVAEFPGVDDPRWFTFDSEHEQGKQQLAKPDAVWSFPAVTDLLGLLHGDAFIGDLERMTGVAGLLPDIDGGGMHQTRWGGFLNMHVDSATDFGDRTTYRRLNVLLYLNSRQEWDDDGGALVLAGRNDDDFTEPRYIYPRWNRLVAFDTTAGTWHGHPVAWRRNAPRRSIAVYYYTAEMPDGFDPERETTFTAEQP